MHEDVAIRVKKEELVSAAKLFAMVGMPGVAKEGAHVILVSSGIQQWVACDFQGNARFLRSNENTTVSSAIRSKLQVGKV